MDEFTLIERVFAPLTTGAPEALDLRDDAAVIAPEGTLVMTKDMLVDGVHFRADDPPALIARKLLRVNLSDLAAMGATARFYLLALAVPAALDDAWLADFAAGLAADQAEFGVHLIGGDTVATDGPLVVSLTAVGRAANGGVLRRDGAQPGDRLYVSGSIGDAALGLAAAQARIDGGVLADRLIDRYLLPRPRLDLGRRLVGLARAAIDISDGLVADVGHLCAASGIGAVIEAGRVPLSEAARAVLERDPKLLPLVLTGGDDYELAFAADPARSEAINEAAARAGVRVTVIGRMVERGGLSVVDDHDYPIDVGKLGYTHR